MARDWKKQGMRVSRPLRTGAGEPRLGPPEGFAGRLVVELWEPGPSSGDGLRYSLELLKDISPSGRDRFVRDAVARLHARMQGRP